MSINEHLFPAGTVRFKGAKENKDGTVTFHFEFIRPDFPSYAERLDNGDCDDE